MNTDENVPFDNSLESDVSRDRKMPEHASSFLLRRLPPVDARFDEEEV